MRVARREFQVAYYDAGKLDDISVVAALCRRRKG